MNPVAENGIRRNPAQFPQIVHIIGSGHSGSTLLDMMLGGHSRVSSLGEAYFLHFNIRNRRKMDICTCGEHVLECPFWSAVEEKAKQQLKHHKAGGLAELTLADPRLESLMDNDGVFRERKPGEKYPYRSFLNYLVLLLGSRRLQHLAAHLSFEVNLHKNIGRDTAQLYRLVQEAHDTPVIVDSTKNPGTFKNVYINTDNNMKFILIVRDGRAVCWSRMRRESVTVQQAAQIWKLEHYKRVLALLTIPSRKILQVHYEELASSPNRTLRKICHFLDLEFQPEMLDFRRDRHNLGGNPMRLRRKNSAIKLDDSWRQNLSTVDLEKFERIAGKLNRRNGYI